MTATGSRTTPAFFSAVLTCDGLVTMAFAPSAMAVASVSEVGAGASSTRRVDAV